MIDISKAIEDGSYMHPEWEPRHRWSYRGGHDRKERENWAGIAGVLRSRLRPEHGPGVAGFVDMFSSILVEGM